MTTRFADRFFSFVVMTELDIAEALTGDPHFEQAGFRAFLGEV
jgi:hypothetical protein